MASTEAPIFFFLISKSEKKKHYDLFSKRKSQIKNYHQWVLLQITPPSDEIPKIEGGGYL